MDREAIVAEAEALQIEFAAAVETILDAAEGALSEGRDLAIAGRLQAIVLACAVQDIAGQRLSRILRAARGEGAGALDAEGLLNGPPAPGAGLSQAQVDALLCA